MAQDNDEIIELTDMVTQDSSPNEDQEIIELTDIVPETEPDAQEPETTGLSASDAPESPIQDPLDLDQDALSMDKDTLVIESSFSDEDLSESVPDRDPVPDIDSGGSDKMFHVSQEELESALERVIEKKFSKTIEPILFQVMEKVIQKEISDIKASLQRDLDDIGKA